MPTGGASEAIEDPIERPTSQAKDMPMPQSPFKTEMLHSIGHRTSHFHGIWARASQQLPSSLRLGQPKWFDCKAGRVAASTFHSSNLRSSCHVECQAHRAVPKSRRLRLGELHHMCDAQARPPPSLRHAYAFLLPQCSSCKHLARCDASTNRFCDNACRLH